MIVRAVVFGLMVALVPSLLGVPAPAAGTPMVTQILVKTLPGRVQVGIVATGPVTYRTFTLDQPDRFVADVQGATDGIAGTAFPVHRGPVTRVRVAQFTDDPPVVRVVVELRRAVPAQVAAPSPNVVALTFPTPAASAAAKPQGGAAGPTPANTAGESGTAGVSADRSGPTGTQAAAPTAGTVSAGPGGITVAQQGAPGQVLLNLDLRGAALPDVLDALARLCGLNIVTDSSVSGTVTVHLVGVTCAQALGYVLDANSLGYRRLGQTLIVESAQKLAPPPPGPVTRVYRLRYLQPPFAAPEPLVGSVGATTAGGSGIAGGAGRVPKDVSALTGLFSGTGASVKYDDRTNSLVVTGTPAQQQAVQALLRQLDVPVPQVLVQAVVVDITATSLRNLGIEWSVLQGSTGTPFVFQEVPPPGITVGGTPPGQLGVQPVTRDALLARLNAFVSEGTAKVLSDPRVATADGQEALIFAGDQFPIANTTTAGNPPVTTTTITFQPTGVTLKIIPKVNADRTVTLQVHPVVTTITGFTPPVGNNSAGLPLISVREAVTSLRVGNGDSIILGGLLKYSDIKNLKKVPFLGDLPLIGSLFRLTTVNHTESEVVIIVTPEILTAATPAPAP